MGKRYRLSRLLILTLFVGLLMAASGKTVFVNSLKANIMKEPAFKGEVLSTVKQGTQLDVLEQDKRWYKVSHEGVTGWVSGLLVRSEPPKGVVSVFEGQEKDISRESRKRASAVTTAAAARGLTAEDRRRLGHTGIVDYDALEKVESISINQSELTSFIEHRQ